MKASCWYGTGEVPVESVADPAIQAKRRGHATTSSSCSRIEDGEIDPSFVITHRISLDEAPAAYKTFRDKEDGCIRVVIKP